MRERGTGTTCTEIDTAKHGHVWKINDWIIEYLYTLKVLKVGERKTMKER